MADSTTGGEARQRNADPLGILVIELWNIGDVILTMPFLAQLRRKFPAAHISLLARSFAPELLAGTGLVDEYLLADLAWTPEERRSAVTRLARIVTVARRLRKRRFDLAFSARRHLRERILLAMSGAARRIGVSDRKSRFGETLASGTGSSQKVERWLSLLDDFGGAVPLEMPKLNITAAERSWATGYIGSRGIQPNSLLVGIHPGASVPEKRWPIERFREVATTLSNRPGVSVLAFAEPTPSQYGQELFAIPAVVGARVSLRELIALIARCDLLVCNDSGPMHIAGALGIPTVAMFGAEIDKWFAPLGSGHEIVQSETLETGKTVRSPQGIPVSRALDAVGRILLSLGRR